MGRRLVSARGQVEISLGKAIMDTGGTEQVFCPGDKSNHDSQPRRCCCRIKLIFR